MCKTGTFRRDMCRHKMRGPSLLNVGYAVTSVRPGMAGYGSE
jgi:hypothetical protein